jgi:hypothetical protein
MKLLEKEARERVELKKVAKLAKQRDFVKTYPKVKQHNRVVTFDSRLESAVHKRNDQ